MARRRRSGPKVKKPKRVSYELIRPEDPMGTLMYEMLKDVVSKWHDDLINAQIVLAWNTSWKADIDGRVKLGMCKKASDLDRELVGIGRRKDTVLGVDFIVVLQKQFWKDESVSDGQRTALLDHELSHATLKLDADHEPVEDERGRKVYRIVKHDLEEFSAVVARHGMYKKDIEVFAKSLQRAKQRGLFDAVEAVETIASDPKVQAAVEKLRPKKGEGSVTIEGGGKSVTLYPKGEEPDQPRPA